MQNRSDKVSHQKAQKASSESRQPAVLAVPDEVPTLRVLCLHDIDSNALQLHSSLEELDERLYNNHRIEFVYINSPLLIDSKSYSVNDKDNDSQQKEEQQPPKRTWYDEEEALVDVVDNEQEAATTDNINVDKITYPSSNNKERTTTKIKKYVGLDASLLHIKQVWNTCPFVGILSIGQGSAVSSLLTMMCSVDSNIDNQSSLFVDSSTSNIGLNGLQFAIFVDGYSLIDNERDDNNNKKKNICNDNNRYEKDHDEKFHNDDDDSYSSSSSSSSSLLVANNELECLHIIHEDKNNNENKISSKNLVKQIGGEIYYSRKRTSSSSNANSLSKSDFNAIGKFLVKQKKRLLKPVVLSSQLLPTATTEKMTATMIEGGDGALQCTSNKNKSEKDGCSSVTISSHNDEESTSTTPVLSSSPTATTTTALSEVVAQPGPSSSMSLISLQNQLYHIEKEASNLVIQHAINNPPNSLMALISPTTSTSSTTSVLPTSRKQEGEASKMVVSDSDDDDDDDENYNISSISNTRNVTDESNNEPKYIVGGWQGPRRRQPNDEGGGAPCPSSFTLPKNDRPKS